jgi:hypothetical protein
MSSAYARRKAFFYLGPAWLWHARFTRARQLANLPRPAPGTARVVAPHRYIGEVPSHYGFGALKVTT